MWQRLNLLLLIILTVSCGKPSPTLQQFDTEKWKSDKDGCKGERKELFASLDTQRSALLGFDEMQLVELLGKPDQNELSKRNQKFYFYFIDPGPNCSEKPDSTAKKLSIRFNAMGLAKEVLIE